MEHIVWVSGPTVQLSEDEQIEAVDSNSSENNPGDVTWTTNHHHCQVDDRVCKVKVVRSDDAQLRGMIDTGNAREEGSRRECQQFGIRHIDATRSRGPFIVADGYPGAT